MIGDFIKDRPHDRIGVVKFDADAFLVSPLTLDHDWLVKRLKEEKPGAGTAPGSGLLIAAEHLLPATNQTKIAILVSDAEQVNRGPPPADVARAIAREDIKVHFIQIVDFKDMGTLNRENNEMAQIPKLTGGQLFQVADTAGLKSVQADRAAGKGGLQGKQAEELPRADGVVLRAGAAAGARGTAPDQHHLEAAAMKFAQILWLALIVVVIPACLLLLRWSARRKRASLGRAVAPRLHEQLLRSVDYSKRRLKAVLLIAGLVLLIAALSRPLLGFREIKIEKPGVDVIIALDISRSMLAEDAMWKENKTNRLAAAKLGINRMIDRLTTDRVGLMIFAGEPFLMAPVTTDHNSVQRTLTAVTPSAISKPGSDIAAAIKMALKSFDEKQDFGKAIVILSDGEELQGDAITAAREAATKGVGVFTVGIGSTTGAKIPDRPPNPPSTTGSARTA